MCSTLPSSLHEGLAFLIAAAVTTPMKDTGRRGWGITMKLDEKAIEQALHRWQGILRLRDWDIRIEIVRVKWRKRGDIKIDSCNRLAVLLINQVADPAFIDELVLHELLHLKLYGLDQMVEELLIAIYGTEDQDPKRKFAHGQFMERLESTTQDLTKALLTTARGDQSLSSTELDRALKEELNAD
jgi:hypothetical protein